MQALARFGARALFLLPRPAKRGEDRGEWASRPAYMNAALFLLVAFGVGFATGLRTFTPLALICWVAVWGWIPLGSSRLAFLGTEIGAMIVSVLAAVELIADKLPMTPSRISA